MKCKTKLLRNGNALIFIICCLLALTSCNRNKSGLTMEFVMQNRENIDAQHFLFDDNDIKIVDWDKQIFKLKDYEKVNRINDYLKYNPAVKSYVSVSVNGELLYNVSIVAIAASTKFCSYCPKMFVNRGNTILNVDSTIGFYVQNIPGVV